ncbi:MAG: GNAT superfamily N-acetyltransferase [Rhodothermales bacterium]|jgi:GNAT superfamily N-acetyltransferase
MRAPETVIRSVGSESLPVIDALNREIFGEDRIINSFDREDLLMLLAESNGQPVGFKLGYRQNRLTYYSAKGGVVEAWRNRGVAAGMLDWMLDYARGQGYKRFAYDTFPNMHPGMAALGLKRGFRLTEAEFNRTYEDFRLRFETPLI